MKKGIFAVVLSLVVTTPLAASEFTTLFDTGGSFIGVPHRLRLMDGHYLTIATRSTGFGAEIAAIGHDVHLILDTRTLELRAVGAMPGYVSELHWLRDAVPLVDGRYTAFVSDQGHLLDPAVPDDHVGDVLLFADLDAGIYTAISALPDGTFPRWTKTTRSGSLARERRFSDYGLAVSRDARYVVYWSSIGALAPGGDADDEIWNLYAYDRAAATTTLLTPVALAAVSKRPARAWFLADGRLVTSLPLAGDDRYVPVVFPTLGAPPVPLFDNVPAPGAILEHVTDDGRFGIFGEQQDGYGSSTLFARSRIDLNSRAVVRVCDNMCGPVKNASADARYVSYRGHNLDRMVDVHTGQSIDSLMRYMSVSPDGNAMYGYQDGLFLRRAVHRVNIVSNVRGGLTTPDDDADEGRGVWFTYEVRNDGDRPVAITIRHATLFGSSSAGAQHTTLGRECDELGVYCTIREFKPGEVWSVRAMRENPSIGTYTGELTVDSWHYLFMDPATAEKSATVAVLPEADSPTPTPAPPSSGGGGNFGWWVLPLAAFGVRRVRYTPLGAKPTPVGANLRLAT